MPASVRPDAARPKLFISCAREDRQWVDGSNPTSHRRSRRGHWSLGRRRHSLGRGLGGGDRHELATATAALFLVSVNLLTSDSSSSANCPRSTRGGGPARCSCTGSPWGAMDRPTSRPRAGHDPGGGARGPRAATGLHVSTRAQAAGGGHLQPHAAGPQDRPHGSPERGDAHDPVNKALERLVRSSISPEGGSAMATCHRVRGPDARPRRRHQGPRRFAVPGADTEFEDRLRHAEAWKTPPS